MRVERIKIPLKANIIGPPAKGHLMAFHWRADDGPKLNAGLVFQGIWTIIAKKPCIFLYFFRGGGLDALCPPLDPRMQNMSCVYSKVSMKWLFLSTKLLNKKIFKLLGSKNVYHQQFYAILHFPQGKHDPFPQKINYSIGFCMYLYLSTSTACSVYLQNVISLDSQ